MPKIKIKTKKGAAKRFKVTGTGKLKRRHAYTGHLLSKKKSSRKRKLRKSAIVTGGERKSILKTLVR
ncbi:MAG: 50S ribosomal protein L35 [Spirochaetes bacterium]|nr:50S ribosomal protein L35 [Spirochaetota bacterium]